LQNEISIIISIIYQTTKSLSINPIKVVLGFPFSILVIAQQKFLPVSSINVIGFPFSILVIVQQKVC
jgi:preprotein translocase subunit Sec61beta